MTHFSVVLAVLFASGCSSKFDNNPEEPATKSKFDKMTPYEINGKWYYPKKEPVGTKFKGIASWYGEDYHGKKTANGEIFNMYAKTAAHKTLPMNTMLFVKNVDNGKSTIIRVNDRGPFVDGREIDLSKKSASEIDLVNKGSVESEIIILGYDGLIDDDILRKAQLNNDNKTTNNNNNSSKNNDEKNGIVSNGFDGLGIIDETDNQIDGKISNVVVVPRDEEIEIIDGVGSKYNNNEEDYIPISKQNSKNVSQNNYAYNSKTTTSSKKSNNSSSGKKYYAQILSSSNPDGIIKFIAENERKLPSHLKFIKKEEGGKIKVWIDGFRDEREAREFVKNKEYFDSAFLVIRAGKE